jgi:hypothetical protein
VFYVPGREVLPEQRYAVEVFEEGSCSAPGSLGAARFPESGSLSLGARTTGNVRLVLVPVRYDTDGSRRLPDTSTEHVADMTGLLGAVFPVSGLEVSVRKPVATEESDFGDILNQLIQLRELDDPPSDVAYFGLVNMAPTMEEYCRGGCVAGVATFGTPAGAAAAGVGIGFRGPAQETFVHELGHIHRLMHSPCGGASGPDPNYPYRSGRLGSWGYDARTGLLIDPNAERRDFMSYCDPSWISDYNYQALVDRLALVNGRRYSDKSSELADYVAAPSAASASSEAVFASDPSSGSGSATAAADSEDAPIRVYRTLRAKPGRALRWGAPLATRRTPPGEAEEAKVFDGSGNVVATITVFRQELSDEQGAFWFVPQPEPAWERVQVRGEKPVEWGLSPEVKPFSPAN